MYTPQEWTVIRQGLDLVTISGKNAKDLIDTIEFIQGRNF